MSQYNFSRRSLKCFPNWEFIWNCCILLGSLKVRRWKTPKNVDALKVSTGGNTHHHRALAESMYYIGSWRCLFYCYAVHWGSVGGQGAPVCARKKSIIFTRCPDIGPRLHKAEERNDGSHDSVLSVCFLCLCVCVCVCLSVCLCLTYRSQFWT